MSEAWVQTTQPDDLRDRNRRLVRILLTIMATLVVASLLVGVRW